MPAAAPSRSLTGALLALGGWAAFSLQDALVKSLVVDLPVPEVLFGRSLVIVCLTRFVVKRADYRAMAERAQRDRDHAAFGAHPARVARLLPRLALAAARRSRHLLFRRAAVRRRHVRADLARICRAGPLARDAARVQRRPDRGESDRRRAAGAESGWRCWPR